MHHLLEGGCRKQRALRFSLAIAGRGSSPPGVEILGSQGGKHKPQAASAQSLHRLGCVRPGGPHWRVPEQGWRQPWLAGSELRKGIR